MSAEVSQHHHFEVVLRGQFESHVPVAFLLAQHFIGSRHQVVELVPDETLAFFALEAEGQHGHACAAEEGGTYQAEVLVEELCPLVAGYLGEEEVGVGDAGLCVAIGPVDHQHGTSALGEGTALEAYVFVIGVLDLAVLEYFAGVGQQFLALGEVLIHQQLVMRVAVQHLAA